MIHKKTTITDITILTYYLDGVNVSNYEASNIMWDHKISAGSHIMMTDEIVKIREARREGNV